MPIYGQLDNTYAAIYPVSLQCKKIKINGIRNTGASDLEALKTPRHPSADHIKLLYVLMGYLELKEYLARTSRLLLYRR